MSYLTAWGLSESQKKGQKKVQQRPYLTKQYGFQDVNTKTKFEIKAKKNSA